MTLDECRQNNGKVETKFAVANRPSDVVSRIHVYVHLVYVHMYAAYDIQRPICDSEFSKPSHLCFAVHMCPSPICDIRCPIRCMFTKYGEGQKEIRRRKSAVGCRKPHTCVHTLRIHSHICTGDFMYSTHIFDINNVCL